MICFLNLKLCALIVLSTSIYACSTRSQDTDLAIELADWSALLPVHSAGVNTPESSAISEHSYEPDEVARIEHLVTLDAVQAPLEPLLFALARDAGLELQLHEPLPETVTLRANERPLESVLQRLAAQAAIHWQQVGNVLNVWGNSPYTQSYAVDYLNVDRTTVSSVGLATQVGTINADASSSAGGIANNSQTLIENRMAHNFWKSLAGDLAVLLARDSAQAQNAFTINRDAGLLTLRAGVQDHQMIATYLREINASAQRQVLIEATVVEVALSDRFEAGIDWQILADNQDGVSAAQVFSGAPVVNAESVERLGVPNGLFSLVQASKIGSITATLSLLEQFGDVRILSRPRIIALNNQSSVLKVVNNRVYFTVNVERQSSENRDEVVTETEIHTVPVGLVMNVTPYINRSGDVMLNVRPTLSRILGFVDDPNPELAAANVRNGVPEIQVREMESMLRVRSGEMAIIGGLMQDTVEDTNRRLPWLGQLPGIRYLFSQQQRQRRQTELLIVLRPTVMPPPTNRKSLALLSH